jgi:hypothetical protein
VLTIGVLPGFIWGWFHVPDNHAAINWQTFMGVYTMPVCCGIISLTACLILYRIFKNNSERVVINCFAAAAVSCYYWYRIPELFGFGNYAGDGLLVNLRNVLPQWSMAALPIATTIFFFIWLVFRRRSKKSWVLRPRFEERELAG